MLNELSETYEQVGVPLLHSLDFELFGCLVFSTHMWGSHKSIPLL